MRLNVLGADGTFPGPGGACSGYLLQQDGFPLWIDAGTGTLARLQYHVQLEEVGAIFLSHMHPDHCVDLLPYFYAVMYGCGRPGGMPIVAPAGVRDTLAHLLGEHARARFGDYFDWRELAPGDETEVGPFRLEVFDSRHPAPNLAVRVSAGGDTLCYSGDTGPSEFLPRAADGAALFLCESSWQDADDGDPSIHLRAREAGRAAREANVRRLVLTHVWPRHDLEVSRAQAAEEFGGPIDLAARAEGAWEV